MELPAVEPLLSAKPVEVYDRDTEWRALQALWQRPRPQLAFVLGRRRVGKSFVLSRFARAVGGIYYQATRRTESEQLGHLTRIIGEHFDDAALRQGVSFPSWERLLAYVAERAGDQPLLLVLDEFPYLAEAAPALPSILQRAWDHEWASSRLKVVLSGSFVTAMRALEAADQPLYGRRTAKLVFGPFSFADAAGFMPGLSAQEGLLVYALFGNLPGHLAVFDPERSVADNAADALLSPSGPLVDDAQHMLDGFLADGRTHYSILEAIASGDRTWSGITRRVGQRGGSLLRPLRWLEEMGLVRRVVPITAAAPQRSKRALYRIADPYLTFWHRTIAPLLHSGSVGLVEPGRLWEEVVSQQLTEHLGPVLEEACRQLASRGTQLPFAPLQVGEWWSPDAREQLDLVALGARGELLVGECKWGAVGRSDLVTLRRRAALVAGELSGARSVHLALFSALDRADETVRAAATAGEVLYFTGGDLWRA